ncbi:MAG TPA: hypothetical protein VFM18_04345 [Methanosarcina sp.]|nr:hypothetical protein [Methanosarcina sp.]
MTTTFGDLIVDACNDVSIALKNVDTNCSTDDMKNQLFEVDAAITRLLTVISIASETEAINVDFTLKGIPILCDTFAEIFPEYSKEAMSAKMNFLSTGKIIGK